MTAAAQDEIIGEVKDVSSFQVALSSRPSSSPSLPDTHEHDAQYGDKAMCTHKRASKGGRGQRYARDMALAQCEDDYGAGVEEKSSHS